MQRISNQQNPSSYAAGPVWQKADSADKVVNQQRINKRWQMLSSKVHLASKLFKVGLNDSCTSEGFSYRQVKWVRQLTLMELRYFPHNIQIKRSLINATNS